MRLRKWTWLGHTLRRRDDIIELQRMPQWPQRKITTTEHVEERYLEKEIWTAGYKYRQLEEDGGGSTEES